MPAPSTATTAPGSTFAMTACTAHAVGSTMTAASSLMPSGTACSCDSCATMNVDQPPPVSQQKPDCRPGSMCPKAMRSQLPRSPRAHASQRGEMPRATQPSTGSMTTPGVVVAVGDDFVTGDERERHDGVEVPRRSAVHGREVAAADAREAGPDAFPTRTGQVGRIGVDETQRAHPRATAGEQLARDARGGVPRRPSARRAAPSRLSLHERASRRGRGRRSFATVACGGPIGSRGRADAGRTSTTARRAIRACARSSPGAPRGSPRPGSRLPRASEGRRTSPRTRPTH